MINLITRLGIAIAVAMLTGCASPHATDARIADDVKAMFVALPAIATTPVVSEFDKMRAALPAFSLERASLRDVTYGEVSIIRDIVFAADRDILSDREVARIELLKLYLRTHATVSVRIEGYGDGRGTSERKAELSLARAQAIKRAILTDIMVSNTIDCIGAAGPQSKGRDGSAEIIFIGPAT